MSEWCKVKCPGLKCGKEFPGEYLKGSFVFCNPCARWIEAGEDDGSEKVRLSERGSEARPRKVKIRPVAVETH